VVGRVLVLTDEHGKVLDAALMNEKAFRKSTENGVLWTVHPDTGRVLPYRRELGFSELKEDGELYRAVVDSAQWSSSAVQVDYAYAESDSALRGVAQAADSGWGEVLQGLVAVIADRKKTLPEGSYTSYLFNAGESKIRKKTGEEAVELILSSDSSETASEAADLIYHLLVLLEQLEIPFDEVVRELEARE
jgi:phosphoribosyl-ATP pyrophosphohydrolase